MQKQLKPKNVDEMSVALQNVKNSINFARLQSLVDTMPKQMQIVLATKGGATRW